MTAGSWHSLPDREMPTFGHFDTTSIEDDEVRSALERIKQELEQLNRGCAKPLYGMRAHCWMPDVTPVRYGYYMASFNEMVLSVPLTDNEVTTRKIMLPDAATRPGGYVEVVDYAGDSATTNITVATIKGQTINGATTFTINENYSAIQFRSDGACWRVVGKGGGATVITDHGGLSGLADDDHSQYHNDARGDARYLQKSNNLSDLASDDTAIGNLVGGGTNRTPTELYDIPIRDSVASNHGKASIGGILTMTATSLAFGGTPVLGQIPRWHKIAVAYNQAGLGDQAAATANATLFTLPSGGMIHAVVMKNTTAWNNGGGGARIEASVGIAGTLNKYAASWRWDTAVSTTNFQLSTVQGIEAIGATTAIKTQWDASAGPVNLNTGTVGSIDYYILLSAIL